MSLDEYRQGHLGHQPPSGASQSWHDGYKLYQEGQASKNQISSAVAGINLTDEDKKTLSTLVVAGAVILGVCAVATTYPDLPPIYRPVRSRVLG